MTSQIDVTKPIFGTPTTQSVRDNFTTAANEITALQQASNGSPFLPLLGGRMTGAMYLFNDPTDGMMPATKGYVDAQTGSVGGGIPEAPADANTYGRHNGAWTIVLPIAGGTLTGPLVLAADPTVALGAVTKQYADAIAASHLTDAPNDATTYGRHANAWTGVLPLTGGRVTGNTSIGPAIPANASVGPSLFLTQLNTVGGTSFNLNAFLDNATPTPAFRYAAAGQAATISMGLASGGLGIYVAPPGALNGAIAWGPPTFLDYKGNLMVGAALTIPTDTANPALTSPEIAIRAAGHVAWNGYIATGGGGWKYLQSGFAGYMYQDASTGQMDIGVWPSGSAGGAVPGVAGLVNLFQNGHFQCSYIDVIGGRVVSRNSGNNPSVAVWDMALGAAYCMFMQPGINALKFATADGSGNPMTQILTIDSAGTMTTPGDLYARNFNFSGQGVMGGPLYANAGIVNINNYVGLSIWGSASNQRFFGFEANCYIVKGDDANLSHNVLQGGAQYWNVNGGAMYLRVGDGAFVLTAGNGFKPGGGSWGDSSDARIKTVEGDYSQGLAAIVQLKPCIFTFKGNESLDRINAPVSAAMRARLPLPIEPMPDDWIAPTEPHPSDHAEVAETGQRYIGLVAQDVEGPMPEMVTLRSGTIDGQHVDDIRLLDTSALSMAFINAFKEVDARLRAGGL